jgi:alanine dehydrogenase
MRIGVPREIKPEELRVGLTPASVREATARGHEVFVETGAAAGIGFSDDDYRTAGAKVLDSAEAVFEAGELIVKVKEPQAVECARLTERHTLFAYLHLAPDPDQTRALLDSGCTAIAFETVTDDQGGLPLLKPMSEVAGKMSALVGAQSLMAPAGGMGQLVAPVTGVEAARIVILGGGVAGTGAAELAVGLGAQVTILERSLPRLTQLKERFGNAINAVYSTVDAVERHVLDADLVIGAVLLPGARAPKLIDRDLVAEMCRGSVLVDIAIDQGGCIETSRPTTHAAPTYTVDGVVHYCVANMPGAVPRTSTQALNHAILPHALALADLGWQAACERDRHLANGLNVQAGRLVHPAVEAAFAEARATGWKAVA